MIFTNAVPNSDSYSALARRTVSPVFGILVDAIVTFNGMALGAVFLVRLHWLKLLL